MLACLASPPSCGQLARTSRTSPYLTVEPTAPAGDPTAPAPERARACEPRLPSFSRTYKAHTQCFSVFYSPNQPKKELMMSFTIDVPFAVPSLTHSSAPFVPSFAEK